MGKVIRSVMLLFLLSGGSVCAKSLKVVYDLRSGDKDVIHKQLINTVKVLSAYYEKNNKKLDVIVVISGKAYKYFIDDIDNSPYWYDNDLIEVQKRLKPRLEMLHEMFGVKFQMCVLGMTIQEIEKKTLYPYVEAEAMRSIYLIDAQNDGYAYLPLY